VAGRTLRKLDSVVAEIADGGGNAIALEMDVTVSEQVRRGVEATVSTFGRLDVLFCNAGCRCDGRAGDVAEDEWDRCLAVNLTGAFLCARHTLPVLERSGRGVILFTSGTFGLRPWPSTAAYAVAKAGVISLAKSIALDYASSGIRCVAICPGYVDTPLNADQSVPDAGRVHHQPLRGVITTDQVATLALFLASDHASMITGHTYVIDGGQLISVV
jgi:3-oxoacyl-[acyl-carrier protein] reductase